MIIRVFNARGDPVDPAELTVPEDSPVYLILEEGGKHDQMAKAE